MHESYRTREGWVRAEHLRNGEIEQRGWRSGEQWHVVRLRLVRAKPELWQVEHRITSTTGPSLSQDSQLFNTLAEARAHMKQLLKDPPTSYAIPEIA